MRKIKEVLRLKFEVGLELRQIARSYSIGILDPLVHNAHRIEMRGDSMRKGRGKPSA